jgi:hypothetical protein
MSDTYTITRPIMTAAELREHRVETHPRNFMLSGDGYDDMALNEAMGWTTRASWGSDGWDLGTWPYVVLSTRRHNCRFEVLSVCEGDHELYVFDTEADQHAALDYLFLWYRAEDAERLFGFPIDRAALDAGEVTVDDRFRGPYRTKEVPA